MEGSNHSGAGLTKHLFVRTCDVVDKGLWRIFPAINVNKTADIPKNYPGPMGVPITFMDKFSATQFELLGYTHKGTVKGRHVYARLLVRNLKPELPEFIDLFSWFERLGVPLEIEELGTEK